MSHYHVEHFGCRAARADGEAVSDRLRLAGLDEQGPATADLVVVNTCSVTAEADRAARAFIRRTHRLNPEARILVTGCYAQRAPEELASLDGVSAVVGNSHKALAPEIALSLLRERRAKAPASPLPAGEPSALKAPPFGQKTAGLSQESTRLSRKSTDSISTGTGFSPKNTSFNQHGIAIRLEGTGFSPYISHTEEKGPLGPEANSPAIVTVQSILASHTPAPIWADDRFAHSFLEEAPLAPGAQTRPNLKIQEGCGNRCTFCVIPQTRGSSRSLPAATILKQIEGFVAAGGNELVLSGINLGRWGRDLPASGSPRTLAALVRQIFAQTGLPRLRLSSIEPMDWDAELIGLMAEFGGLRLARHAHLPLQSGSDAVLRRMHRRYRPWHYADKVAALLRAAGPALTLGADVMAGFPGETAREFEETLALLRSLPFAYLHLFPFSPRPGTRGWALHAESPVPAALVDERMAALRALAAQKTEAHRRAFAGQTLDALTLHTPAALQARGRTSALSENFLPVELAGRWPANRLLRIHVAGLTPESALEATADEPFSPDIVSPHSHARHTSVAL